MTYYLDLFTPEDLGSLTVLTEMKISGYREAQKRIAEKVKAGVIFFSAILVRLSRWCGVLEVTSKLYVDDAPIFQNPDPFVCRFKVKPRSCFDAGKSQFPSLSLRYGTKYHSPLDWKRKIGWAQSANLRASSSSDSHW